MRDVERLLIIADDLTGAADSAARCWQAGLPASIYVQPPGPPLPSGAISVTTDSRHLPASAAAAAVRERIDSLAALQEVLWYKKIDSTLRGNIGAELDAMLDALDAGSAQPCAVISPAFPAQDRGLRNGYLVCGAIEPQSLCLPDLLASQSRCAIAHIDLATVRGDCLAAALFRAHASGAQLLVVDAMTDADLQRIVAAAEDALPHVLFCGSAGLVGVLAARTAMVSNDGTVRVNMTDTRPRSVLVVVGSGSKMARRQIEALRAHGGVHCVEIGENGAETEVRLDAASGRRWLLYLPAPAPDTVLDGPQARRLANLLADRAMAVISEVQPDIIILVGGDTAIHLLIRLNVRRLDVAGELLPGMPLTRVDAEGQYAPLVVLKAGNHGDEETLVMLVARLT